MIEAPVHVDSEATTGVSDLRGRTRTCIGCAERVEVDGPDGADLVRLILGPGGEIVVDSGRGGFGRGAHVHARRSCVERAARSGLLRATKGAARSILSAEDGQDEKGEALSTDSLARAIQHSMDRRIEGLLAAAIRSRQVACGADGVTGACRRGDAWLVVVACDAAAAADLTEVRRAVAEGRAVAWGTKERLGGIVAPGAVRGKLPVPSPPAPPETPSAAPRGYEGVGVIAISSRTIADALRHAIQAASAVTSKEVSTTGARPPSPRPRRRAERGPVGTGGARQMRDHRRDG